MLWCQCLSMLNPCRMLLSYKVLHSFHVWVFSGFYSTLSYTDCFTHNDSNVWSYTWLCFSGLHVKITIYVNVAMQNRMTDRPGDPPWGQVQPMWCQHMTSWATTRQAWGQPSTCCMPISQFVSIVFLTLEIFNSTIGSPVHVMTYVTTKLCLQSGSFGFHE